MLAGALGALALLVAMLVCGAMLLLLSNRYVPVAAGWTLAQRASGASWRPPAVCVLLGMPALDVAIWSVKLGNAHHLHLLSRGAR